MIPADILTDGTHFNGELSHAIRNEYFSIIILENELTWTRSRTEETVERRLEVELDDITIDNYVNREFHCRKRPGYHAERIGNALAVYGVDPNNITIDAYLCAGRQVLQELEIPYFEVPIEEAHAMMVMTENQFKTHIAKSVHDLFVGNLGEFAMKEMLLNAKKQFSARALLYHHLKSMQEEKDIRVQRTTFNMTEGEPETEDLAIGVRTQRVADGNYLYGASRVHTYTEAIGDYIVFMNHFGHHLIYVTGVVEKEFLLPKRKVQSGAVSFNGPARVGQPAQSNWVVYPWLESNPAKVFNFYLDHLALDPMQNGALPEESVAALQSHFKKRISLGDLFSRLDDYE